MNTSSGPHAPCSTCSGQGTIPRAGLGQLAEFAGTAGRTTCPACGGSGHSPIGTGPYVSTGPSIGSPPVGPTREAAGGSDLRGSAWRPPDATDPPDEDIASGPNPPAAPNSGTGGLPAAIRALFWPAVAILVLLFGLQSGPTEGVVALVLVLLVWSVAGRRSRRRTTPGSGRIEGYVRGLQQRQHSDAAKNPIQVVSFWVDSEDRDGQRDRVVVEMQGKRIIGSLNEGDRIRIPKSARGTNPIRAKTVDNLTTGAPFRVKGSGLAAKLSMGFVSLLSIVMIGGVIYLAANCGI